MGKARSTIRTLEANKSDLPRVSSDSCDQDVEDKASGDKRTPCASTLGRSSVSNDNFFAVPLKVKDVSDCDFYHTMELPGYGVMDGEWDLRRGVDEYLGKVAFAAQRVLEIGPASGFLTFEMEKRGAEVVSVEVTEDRDWDFVPYPASRLEEVFGPRRIVMQRLKNSYWFSHAAHHSRAKVYYGDVYHLPAVLGEFDIAVMGSLLLHCRDPLRIVGFVAIRGCYEINSLTSAFSSFNSATDASILVRLNSLIGSFCTISHLPPRTRTGNDEIRSLSTP
jgi:hypothetical protein